MVVQVVLGKQTNSPQFHARLYYHEAYIVKLVAHTQFFIVEMIAGKYIFLFKHKNFNTGKVNAKDSVSQPAN